MKSIGLTGGIASGKSTVARMLAELGVNVISADEIAHQVMRSGSALFEDIVAHFGSDILNEDGEIDRARLGEIVFANDNERRTLNNLVHTEVIEVIKEDMAKEKGLVAVEVPLLVEADMTGLFDKIVVVTAAPDQQLERLLKKGISEEDALRRISSQIGNDERLRYADYILINKGSLINLQRQVENLLEFVEGQGRG